MLFEARDQHGIFRRQPQAAPDVFLHLSQAWHRLGYGNKGEYVKDGSRNVGFKTFLINNPKNIMCLSMCVQNCVIPRKWISKIGSMMIYKSKLGCPTS